jgi:hypothetical protein
MAETWVRVERADGGGQGDSVFIDANYVDAAGFVGTALRTETGQHTFETLDGGTTVAWRAVESVAAPLGNSEANPVPVTLQPV